MTLTSTVGAALGAGAAVSGTAAGVSQFLGLSDVLWQAIIAGLVTVVIAYFQMRTMLAVREGTAAATAAAHAARKEAHEVSERVRKANKLSVASLGDIKEVTKDTHTLVNGNMSIQLRLNMNLARRLAEETGEEADKEAARLAEKLYEEHMAKDKQVSDRKES